MLTKTMLLIAEQPRYRWARTLVNQVRRRMEMMRVYKSCHAREEHYLQTSSYAGALQGEPVGCFAYFAREKIVTAQVPFQSDVGVRGFE